MLRIITACLAISMTATTWADDPSEVDPPHAPQLHPEDEKALLEAQDSFPSWADDTAPQLFDGLSEQQQRKLFREGLQKAAARQQQQTTRQPSFQPAPAWAPQAQYPASTNRRPHTQPSQGSPHDRRQPEDRPEWVTLLEAAMHLQHIAHQLDVQRLWEPAENVRRAAESLRHSAREMAEAKGQRRIAPQMSPGPRRRG